MGQAFAGVWSLAMPALGLESGLLAVAVLAAASALLALLLVARAHSDRSVATPLHRLATALQELSRQAAYIPLRDPGAAGRPSPRAPGRRSPAA